MTAFYGPQAPFIPRKRDERRPPERLRAHYLAERALADRIRAARTAGERREIFSTMYDELFRVVPDHPRLAAKGASTARRQRDLDWNMAQLAPYLAPGCVFLEIGAGDCALSSRVATTASRVYAVDISDQSQGRLPPNVELVITDGSSIDVPAGTVDLAFSDQLLEHLHPDDALAQVENVHRALKPGGVYLAVTPNRLYGPSDISAFFDDEPRGFHLKEYTLPEMMELFRAAGFTRFHVYVGARGHFYRAPEEVVAAAENAMRLVPATVRRKLGDSKVMRALLGLRVAGVKDAGPGTGPKRVDRGPSP